MAPRSVWRFPCLLSLCTAIASCGSLPLVPLQPVDPKTRLDRFDERDLVLAVDVLADAERVELLFHTDLVNEGVLPIVLHLRNTSPDHDVEVELENAAYRALDGTVFVRVPHDFVREEFDLPTDQEDKLLPERFNLPANSSRTGAMFFRPTDEDLDLEDVELSEGVFTLSVFKRGPTDGGALDVSVTTTNR